MASSLSRVPPDRRELLLMMSSRSPAAAAADTACVGVWGRGWVSCEWVV